FERLLRLRMLIPLLNSTAQRNWPYPASPVLLLCQPSMTWNPLLAGREAARDQEGFAAGVAALYAVPAPVWSPPGRRHPCRSGGSLRARPAARRRRQQERRNDRLERLRRRYLAGPHDPVLPRPVALALSAAAGGTGPLGR